jgi:hypothetical protein
MVKIEYQDFSAWPYASAEIVFSVRFSAAHQKFLNKVEIGCQESLQHADQALSFAFCLVG